MGQFEISPKTVVLYRRLLYRYYIRPIKSYRRPKVKFPMCSAVNHIESLNKKDTVQVVSCLEKTAFRWPLELLRDG